MNDCINLKVKKILNGYIITLDSGNEMYFSNIETILERMKDELELLHL